MTSAIDFYNRLKLEIPFLEDPIDLDNIEINLFDKQIEMLKDLLIAWSKNRTEKDVIVLLKDILKKPNNANGKVYEALVYAWLNKNCISYEPQVHIDSEDCFKLKSGYDADGEIVEHNIVFDVKQFGLTLPHIETLRKNLQSEIPEEYYLTISGCQNISAKDLQKHFLENTKGLAAIIMNPDNKNHTDYIYQDKEYGLEFRAWHKNSNRMITSISRFNLYEWAESNQYYFMHHASQFCSNKPYILFCPFDKSLTPMFSQEDSAFQFSAFRALSRRIFVNLLKMENRKINDFDGKARVDVSIATASRKISAIIFIDVSEYSDYEHCRIFVYQNPNADHRIQRYQIDSLFRFAGATVEDFQFDNY